MDDDNVKPVRTWQLQKWYKRAKVWGPVVLTFISMCVSAALWFDARYMRKEIADIRYNEAIRIAIECKVDAHNRLLESGADISATDAFKHDMNVEQLKNIIKERQELMGIGDIP